MRSVLESYIGIWLIMLFLMLCIGFTSINMNIGQARTIYNSIRAEVQASNGYVVPASNVKEYNSVSDGITIKDKGYSFTYTVKRLSLDDGINRADDETFEYNDIYRIDLKYSYSVPIFGRQVYPISGLVAY